MLSGSTWSHEDALLPTGRRPVDLGWYPPTPDTKDARLTFELSDDPWWMIETTVEDFPDDDEQQRAAGRVLSGFEYQERTALAIYHPAGDSTTTDYVLGQNLTWDEVLALIDLHTTDGYVIRDIGAHPDDQDLGIRFTVLLWQE